MEDKMAAGAFEGALRIMGETTHLKKKMLDFLRIGEYNEIVKIQNTATGKVTSWWNKFVLILKPTQQ